MLKVAFVTNFIPPYRRSFYEKLCHANAQLEWLIVCGNVGEHGRAATTDEVVVPQRWVRNTQFRLGPFTIRWQHGALAAIRDYGPDVLIVLGIAGTLSNWPLLAWARWHKVPVIMWTCGWEPQRPNSLAFGWKQTVGQFYFRAASRLLVYASKGRRYLTEVFGVAASSVDVCYKGIETDGLLAREANTLDQARDLRLREAGGDAEIVLFVGAMLTDKRLDLLIEAFVALRQARPQAQLWLVGDGPERARAEQQVASAGLEGVRFLGRIVEGVDTYFAAADVVVLPGIGGVALNEADRKSVV